VKLVVSEGSIVGFASAPTSVTASTSPRETEHAASFAFRFAGRTS
jgi:hypothetical protein